MVVNFRIPSNTRQAALEGRQEERKASLFHLKSASAEAAWRNFLGKSSRNVLDPLLLIIYINYLDLGISCAVSTFVDDKNSDRLIEAD